MSFGNLSNVPIEEFYEEENWGQELERRESIRFNEQFDEIW